jgi:hypothetical protein
VVARSLLRGRRRAAATASIVVALVVVASVVALGVRSPGGGCQDVQRPGLDPALERAVPSALEGRGPDRLDSAVTCSAAGLGSLASHGVTSVSSAGGLWDLGPSTGVTLVVFRLPGAGRATWIAEFYETGAARAPKVAGVTTSHPTVAGRPATRLDFTDSDFPQSIVVWPALAPDEVNVVLAAGVPERIVSEAIAGFGSR